MLALELVGPSVVHFASGCNVQPNRELTGHPIDRATRNSAQGYLISSPLAYVSIEPTYPTCYFSRPICVAWDLWCVGEYMEKVIEIWIDG